MASNLGNLIVPAVFAKYVNEEALKTNKFVLSGAAVRTPQLQAGLAGAASVYNLPIWKSLTDSVTANVPSLDPAVKGTASTLAAYNQKAVRLERNLAISAFDLEAQLIGEDMGAEAARQFGDIVNQTRSSSVFSVLSAVTSLDGPDAGTVADLYYDGTAGLFNTSTFLKAIASVWGDRAKTSNVVLVVNSVTYSTMQIDQLTAGGIADKLGTGVMLQTYLGAPVIVDDMVPLGKTYVIRQGGIAFGTGSALVPFETIRDPFAGNNAGNTTLFNRDVYAYHVAGTSFTGTPAGAFATDAELATAANWSLIQDKKKIGVMVIAHQ